MITLKEEELFPEGIENRTDLIFASFVPAVAYRFGDHFSIGIALNINFETLELDGLISQRSQILKGKPIQGTDITFGEYLIDAVGEDYIRGEVDTNMLYGFGVGGRVGFLWKLGDRVQLGAMYSPPTWMTNAKGKANLDFNRHFEQIGVAQIIQIVLPDQGRYGFSGEYDVEIELNLPQRAGVGLSWLILDNLCLGVDFQWIDYSETQFELKAEMKNGTNNDLNALAGSPSVKTSFAMGWKDQYVVAAGLVWQASPHWIFRTGYNYGNNPVPQKYLNPQLAGIAEHHISLGCSYLVNRYWSIHSALQCDLPSSMKSDAENLVNPAYAHSKLEFFNISAVFGISMRF